MTCNICKHWAATSERQYRNRLRNMREAPNVHPHCCPACHGIDWAISRQFIQPNWWQKIVAFVQQRN